MSIFYHGDLAIWYQGFREIQRSCWQTAEDHGWHDDMTTATMVEKLCLIHSEVSEALEEWRNGHGANEIYYGEGDNPKPEGVPIELADVVIRVMDLAEIFGIDLAAAISEKEAYNRSRSYRHGGKRL